MDSFEWNKIFGAVLGTVLILATLNIVVGKMMAPHQSGKPGMEVAVAETPANGGETPVAETTPDWGTVIPVADVAAGEKILGRCVQCHDFSKGGPNKIGPNLYGILGAKHAQTPTFTYSPAMKALADKTWGYDEFYEFVRNPKGAVPGTKMAFAGLSKSQDRVNLIAHLRTLSDAPIAVPAPNPVAPPAAPATPPADGTAEPPAGEVQAPPPGSAPEVPATAPPAAPGTTAPPAAPAGAPAKPPGH